MKRDRVNIEHLYKTVYNLQGVRHPVANPGGLSRAAEYLSRRMEASGLVVRKQAFKLDGSPETFANIEGSLGAAGKEPAAVLIAHYDTVAVSPGANDNAASLAVIIEACRVLAGTEDPPPVYAVAATLEESSHPAYAGREHESALKHGVIDQAGRYTSWACARYKPLAFNRAIQEYEKGKTQGEGYRIALAEYGDRLPDNLKAHLEDLADIYAGMTVDGAVGTRSRIGSTRWVEEALDTQVPLSFCIAVDEPGIFSDKPGSQKPDEAIDFPLFTSGYDLDPENRRANFILTGSLADSSRLGAIFAEKCSSPKIDLPNARIDVPANYGYIVQNLAKGLGSDHAPFWKHGIPALFVFDSSTGRDPWNHTHADTIDRLDFNRLGQLTEALVETLLDPRSFREGAET